MSAANEQQVNDWWAEGDAPVRTNTRVTYLIDGRTTMLTMCRHFLMARKYIYLANWGITPNIKLVRGQDHSAGPDGSPEQEALLDELRDEGLSEEAIAFWTTHELTLQNVLGYMVSKGVEVRALPWDCSNLFSHYSPETAHEQLTAVGAICILDRRFLLVLPVY